MIIQITFKDNEKFTIAGHMELVCIYAQSTKTSQRDIKMVQLSLIKWMVV